MPKYLSSREINELSQYRVVRTDSNELFQRMVETYLEMKGDVHQLEETNSDLSMEIDDLSMQNDDLQDEMYHLRQKYEKLEERNKNLSSALKSFVEVLKAENVISKVDLENFDIGL